MTSNKMADDDSKSACRSDNVTSSSDNSSPFMSVRFIALVAALVAFNLVVIVGNSLVIAAVFTYRTLRTVTNTFIVSLAVSDLLLGAVVLPFSSVNEVLGWWPFGRIWCSAWLAIDVWVCTASILNLCAISLDRYLAISRPFRYPLLMSPTRAKVAVAVVWTLALAICLPPLLGWRDSKVVSVANASTAHPNNVDFDLDHTVKTIADVKTGSRRIRQSSFNDSYRMAGAHYSDTYGYQSSVETNFSNDTKHSTTNTAITPVRSNSTPTQLSSSISRRVASAIYNKRGNELIRNTATLSTVELATNAAGRKTNGISRSDFEEVKNEETSDRNFVSDLPVDAISTMASFNTCRVADNALRPVCMLTSEPGYIIYSACGSFWIPMLVMVFFYLKIYRTAVKATTALNSGVLTKKTGRIASNSEVVAVNLRVHRGGGGRAHTSGGYWTSTANRLSNACNSLSFRRSARDRGTTQDQIVTSGSGADAMDRSCRQLGTSESTGCCVWSKTSPRVSSSSQHGNHGKSKGAANAADLSRHRTCSPAATNADSASRRRRAVARSNDNDGMAAAPVPEEGIDCLVQSTLTPMFDQCSASARRSSGGCGNVELVDASPAHAGRRFVQIRAQLRRLNREKKAAKTVGVIVGCFILCWAPFFTVYVLGVFCADCTPPVAFVVFFWLGYCNSAINPFVYALCSKDFRSAFRRLLRCGRGTRHSNSTIAALVSGLRSPARRMAGDSVIAAVRFSPVNRR